MHSQLMPCLSMRHPQDGRWGYAPNLPTRLDGDNLNNYVAVPYANTDPAVQVCVCGLVC